jgi:hypothetical protein
MPERNPPHVVLDDYAMFLLRRRLKEDFFSYICLVVSNLDIPRRFDQPPHLEMKSIEVGWVQRYIDYRIESRSIIEEIAARRRFTTWRPIRGMPPMDYRARAEGLFDLMWANLHYRLAVLDKKKTYW